MATGTLETRAQEWTEDIQLTWIEENPDMPRFSHDSFPVYDGQGHIHVIYTRQIERPDSSNVYYMRLDTIGNILDQPRKISQQTSSVSNLRGILGSSGNIHFTWGNEANHDAWPRYCRFSPSSELLDSTRALSKYAANPLKDSQGNLWMAKPSNKMFKMTENGNFTGDSVMFHPGPKAIAISPNDLVYVFYQVAVPGNVSLHCAVSDFEGNIRMDVPLTDTTRNGAMAGVYTVSISSDSVIYMIYELMVPTRLRCMDMDLVTLFDIPIESTPTGFGKINGTLDPDGNYHMCWQTDSVVALSRYHLNYAVVNNQGEYLSEPLWISHSIRALSYGDIALIPYSLESRQIFFFKVLQSNYPQEVQIFRKSCPPPNERADESVLEVVNLNLSAYPNPFNSTVTIPFSFAAINRGKRSLAIFDPLGRRVADFSPCLPQLIAANRHSLTWNASGMPAGQYIVRLEAGNQQLSQRLSLAK